MNPRLYTDAMAEDGDDHDDHDDHNGGDFLAGEPAEQVPATEEEAQEALRLVESFLPIAEMTRKEIDDKLGARPGFTSKFLRGRARFTWWRLEKIRLILGFSEEQWVALYAMQKLKPPPGVLPRVSNRARLAERPSVELPTVPPPEVLDEIRRSVEELARWVGGLKPPPRRGRRRGQEPPEESPEPDPPAPS
jgi:hypothetical protein